jgi:dihydroflavonol-4-reductase
MERMPGMADSGYTAGPALVTGASGFIGRHLVRALLGQGRRVLAHCLTPEALSDLEHPLLQVIHGNVEDPQSYRPHLHDRLTVFHLAAARAFPETPPDRFHRVNVVACQELGSASAQTGVVRFVYASTAGIFGPACGRCRTEADGPNPSLMRSAYIRSKAEGFVRMTILAEGGLPLVTICPAIVFGPDHPAHPNFVTSHLRRLLRSGLDVVVGGGEARRTLVYVDDVVRGILAAERFGSVGEVYILGGEEVSNREFNRAALELAGRTARLRVSVPHLVARAVAQVADRLRGCDRASGYQAALDALTTEKRYSSQKAQETLGYTWRPLREAIRRTLEFIEGEGENRSSGRQ